MAFKSVSRAMTEAMGGVDTRKMSPEDRKAYWYERFIELGKKHAIPDRKSGDRGTCRKCRGIGHFYHVRHDGYRFVVNCKCSSDKRSALAKADCGIPVIYRSASLANYQHRNDCQEDAAKAAVALQDAMRRVIDGSSQTTPKGLLLHGGVGSGKTDLSCRVANDLIEPGSRRVFFCECSTISVWIQAALNGADETQLRSMPPRIAESVRWGGGEGAVLSNLIDPALLIMDDLNPGLLGNPTTLQKWLEIVLKARHNAGRPTIITTNHKRSELQSQYGDRVYSRLKQTATILPMGGQDHRDSEETEQTEESFGWPA